MKRRDKRKNKDLNYDPIDRKRKLSLKKQVKDRKQSDDWEDWEEELDYDV